MATETTKATTTPRPSRTRATAATKATTAKPAPATKAATKAATAPADDAGKPIVFALEERDETKTYRVFEPPKSSGCVGKLYVPKGVGGVKIALVADEDASE